jgi:hypothetical protein
MAATSSKATNLQTMQVFCLSSLDELAPYAHDWDRLSGGVPFRSWTWLSAWWRHYGQAQSRGTAGHRPGTARREWSPTRSVGRVGRQLLVLCVLDWEGTLVGLAPWYLDDGARRPIGGTRNIPRRGAMGGYGIRTYPPSPGGCGIRGGGRAWHPRRPPTAHPSPPGVREDMEMSSPWLGAASRISHRWEGRVIRLLGSGEVCSDYLSLLCQEGMEDWVAQAVADYLTDLGAAPSGESERWDLLELEAVDPQDRAINRLLEHLAQRGNTVHFRAGPNCWRIELPHTWDEYLAVLSKGHRRQVRRLERRLLHSGRAVLHTVHRADQLPEAIDLLIELHRRRRRTRGGPGCFASRRFTAFHREVIPQLLSQRRLQLHWLELDGKPAAAEYHLSADEVIYAYQSGIDPDVMDCQPGRLITLATLRRAIEQGYRAFDFLRGDEPYKAHFRAQPRPSLAVRVVPNRASARLRHGLWLAGSNVKQWIKRVRGTRR